MHASWTFWSGPRNWFLHHFPLAQAVFGMTFLILKASVLPVGCSCQQKKWWKDYFDEKLFLWGKKNLVALKLAPLFQRWFRGCYCSLYITASDLLTSSAVAATQNAKSITRTLWGLCQKGYRLSPLLVPWLAVRWLKLR